MVSSRSIRCNPPSSVFLFLFCFFFLSVEGGGNLCKLWIARQVSHRLRTESEDAFELDLNRVRQGEGVERIAQTPQFGHPVGVKDRRGAGAEPLKRGLRGLVAATEARADADLALELDRGQEEVLKQTQFVPVQVVDRFPRCPGVVA